MSGRQNPSDFLKQIIGRPVVVKLNSGVDYRGVLTCLDGYMNIVLGQTEEYLNGQDFLPLKRYPLVSPANSCDQ
eukprot:gene6030-11403_t